MRVYIKNRKRRKDEFQFFMHDFVDACKNAGFSVKSDFFPSYKWHARAFLRELFFYFYICIRRILPFSLRRDKALMITANGMTVKDIAFPYYGFYEIIPFLWDVWPYSLQCLIKSFQVFDIKIAFVSSSQVAKIINETTNVKAYWIPEGIETKHYNRGYELKERNNEIFEMGRRKEDYHNIILGLCKSGIIKEYKSSNIVSTGALDDKNVAYTNEELHTIMSDTKIMICFPQCDTNKKKAGDIETLTQRYWEAMLSRCVMLGRAPEELISLIGYNPVIEIDWNNPAKQLESILENIGDYQTIVDKNYSTATRSAGWENRLPIIIKILKENGYSIK